MLELMVGEKINRCVRHSRFSVDAKFEEGGFSGD
jgi:hypothetical protein